MTISLKSFDEKPIQVHPWELFQYESYHAMTIKYSKRTPKTYSNVNIVELPYFYLSKSSLGKQEHGMGILLKFIDLGNSLGMRTG